MKRFIVAFILILFSLTLIKYNINIKHRLVPSTNEVIDKHDTIRLRVATWNICSGRDINENPIDLSGSSKNLLQQLSIDIAGIQEVKQNYSGSINKNQLEALRKDVYQFSMFYKTQSLLDEKTSDYGIGILSKNKMTKHKKYVLPNSSYDPSIVEQRVLSRSEIYIKGKKVILLNTHLSWHDENIRNQQIQYIKEIIADLKDSFILFGDFNVKDIKEYDSFNDICFSAQGYNNQHFQSYNMDDDGIREIDNIFVSKDIKIKQVTLIPTELSDHSILYVDIEL